jgi:hypothetical protein
VTTERCSMEEQSMNIVDGRVVSSDVVSSDLRNAPRIWRDFGSALPFQTRLTQIKPVLPRPNEHGSQVKDQGRRKCCHTKHKKYPYQPTGDVSLLSGQGNT